jgi:NADH-quinone oxidoreductase subunit L
VLHLLAAAAEGPLNTDAGWFIRHVGLIPLLAALSFPLTLAFGKRMPSNGRWIGFGLVACAFALSLGVGANWMARGHVELEELSTEAIGATYTGTAAGDGEHHLVIDAAEKHAETRVTAEEEPSKAAEAEPVHVRPYYEAEKTWFHIGEHEIGFGFHIDGFAVVMLFTVCFISLMVHLFSTEYLRDDRRETHYFASLGLFTAGMLLMVSASTTLQVILGWEIMGLCSFLLIGHWWEESKNSNAALKAFFTTRTGDIGLLVGMSILFFAGGQTFNIAKINQLAISGGMPRAWLVCAAAALFVACIGKSAQFPLHTWLPDAMAGPTPASALIHAATMVVAGVYMVARLYPVFFEGFFIGHPSDYLGIGGLNPIAIIGCITLLIAGGLAFVQQDIKKVLAYSTVSQLGYMVMGLGVGAWTGAIFHLFTHAFFKACLFLCAGSISHGCFHSFDMRDFGGLKKYMPKTFAAFMAGTAALMAIPPMAGFFSKDEILLGAGKNGYELFLVMSALGATLTCGYMTRAVYKTFFGEYTGPHTPEAIEHAEHAEHEAHGHDAHASADHGVKVAAHVAHQAERGPHDDEPAAEHAGHGAHDAHGDAPLGGYPHEGPWNITVPLIVLAVMSFVAGIINVPGVLAFTHFTAIEPIVAAGVPEPHFSPLIAIVSTIVGLSGAVIAGAWYFAGIRFGLDGITERNKVARAGYLFLVNKYYLDELYENVIIKGIKGPIAKAAYWINQNVIDGVLNGAAFLARRSGELVYDRIDQAAIDGTVNGIGAGARGMGRGFKSLASGLVQQYAAMLIGGAAAGALVIYLVTLGS